MAYNFDPDYDYEDGYNPDDEDNYNIDWEPADYSYDDDTTDQQGDTVWDLND